MNVNVNANTSSEVDLRHPALKSAVDIAEESNIDLETAKKQYCYKNM